MLKCGKPDWERLLPYLACLPRLSALGVVPVWEEDVGSRVAILTQLSYVRCTSYLSPSVTRYNGGQSGMQRLLALPALRALDLCVPRCDNLGAAVYHAAHGLTRLARLALLLEGREREGRGVLESILTPLSRLTKLEVWGKGPHVLSRLLWQLSLGNLEHLVLEGAEVSPGSLGLPSSLRHLELQCVCWESTRSS